ncbi:hypothetical protein ACS0TY_003683 [Phlomoides rotata]
MLERMSKSVPKRVFKERTVKASEIDVKKIGIDERGQLMAVTLNAVEEDNERFLRWLRVHQVLIDIVSASANATPGLGRYPLFKLQVIAIATTALEGFKNEAKIMVVALVDMERAFVPPQHFIRWMDRQRCEEELKGRSSKKRSEAEQSILNRATSPQTGESIKSMKENKSNAQEKDKDKDVQEGSALKTAGPEGKITAGFLLKRSTKTNGWSQRWFVLNEKTGKSEQLNFLELDNIVSKFELNILMINTYFF